MRVVREALGNVLAVAEQVELLLADLDRAAAVLRDQHLVAGRNTHGRPLAVLVEVARPDRQDAALVEVLDTRFGKEDAAGRLGLGLGALHQDAVQEGDERLDRADAGLLGEV